jgi:hypothetical protein
MLIGERRSGSYGKHKNAINQEGKRVRRGMNKTLDAIDNEWCNKYC